MTEDRAGEMRAWAEANGFTYEADVPDELLSLPFYLFYLGSDEPVASGSSLLTGDWQGMPVDVFDASILVPDGFQILGCPTTGRRTSSSRRRWPGPAPTFPMCTSRRRAS